MPVELPAIRTKFTPLRVAELVVQGLRILTSEEPSLACVFVFCGQSAEETGWWEECFDNDFANTKHMDGDGHDWCFYPCGEELDIRTARALVETDPTKHQILPAYSAQAKIVRVYGNGQMASVHFDPKHPYSAFAAFEKELDGLLFWLAKFTNGRYKPAMTCARAGDAVGFAKTIGALHYYTADPNIYAATLSSIVRNYPNKLPAGWSPALVPQQAPPTPEDHARTTRLIDLAVDWTALNADRDATVQAEDDEPTKPGSV